MNHRAIYDLRLLHAYCTDGRCVDVAIDVDAETARLLTNCRCLLRPSADGVRIVTQLDASGEPFLPLPPDSVLRFDLRVRNPDFALYTDLAAIAAQPAPLYTSDGTTAEDEGALRLTSVTKPGRRRPGRLAQVELRVRALQPGEALQPASFHISFPAKRARWAYYCIIDQLQSGSDLRIVDASPAGTTDVLKFSDANRTQLDVQPDKTDPIGVQLLARHRTQRCVRLLSDDSVACRQEPRKYLELRLGDERLLGSLPNPSVRDRAREDLLFRVVKYQTQPLQNH